jgi:hypothetical protein
MDPINYNIDVQTPFQSALQGYQAGAAIRDDQQHQAVIQQQQGLAQQQAQVIHSLVSNPNASASDYANATLLVPGMREQFKQSWDQKNSDQQQSDLSQLSQVYAALQSGAPDAAAKLLTDRATALRNSGNVNDAQHAEALAGVVQEHPDFARTLVGLKLAAVPGGDKVVDQARLLNNDPANSEKLAADAESARIAARVATATMPDKIAAASLANQEVESQITDRAKRFGLDVDKFRSDTGLKVQELQNKLGELPEFVAKDVTTAATDSIAAQQSAAKMTDLAARLEALDPSSGLTAKGAEAIKKVTGNQNEVTRIRAEYNRLVTPAAMAAYKTVASGSTSDKDIETAMTGVPSDTADASTMASFLRGAAKLQVYDSVVNNAKSEWLQSVHSLGKSPRDITVDGVTVPAGTTFKAFTDNYVAKKVAAQVNANDVSTRSYMKYATPDTTSAPLTDAVSGGAAVAP